MAGVQTFTSPRELFILRNHRDNDRIAIMDMKTFPTEDEIRRNHKEFLPPLDPVRPHFLTDPIGRYLNTHFRLLRHSIFGSFKGSP